MLQATQTRCNFQSGDSRYNGMEQDGFGYRLLVGDK
jgi:hypothetical protein